MEHQNLDYVWQQIIDLIKADLSDPLWNSSFSGSVAPLSLQDTTIEIGIFVSYKKDIITKNPIIFNALSNGIQKILPHVETLVLQDLSTGIKTDLSLHTSHSFSTSSFPQKNVLESANTMQESPVNDFLSTEAYDSTKDYEPTHKNQSIPSEYDIPSYGKPIAIDQSTSFPTYESKSLFSPTDFSQKETKPHAYESIDVSAQLIDVNLRENKLNDTFTFKTFISGGANRMAFATAQNVADHPGTNYNPLYIYGKPGLGKTHLMHAIGNHIKQTNPDARILYTTSENFLNFFVGAIKNKKNDIFRNKFRNVDILLIDDIQFLENGNLDSTKEEFFHTFNTLLENGSQIVLTSDVVPDDFKSLEQRLISRFKAGLVVEITSPDPEIIMAILMNYVDNERARHPELYISPEIIQFFGTYFDKQSIRDLQGAFNRLITRASIDNRLSSIDVEYTQEVLHDLLPKIDKAILSIKFIQEFVASYYNMSPEKMLGKGRQAAIVLPRQIAMYLCRTLLNESYPQISLAFHKKDHTTSLKAIENIQKKIEKDPDFNRTILDIQKRISEMI